MHFLVYGKDMFCEVTKVSSLPYLMMFTKRDVCHMSMKHLFLNQILGKGIIVFLRYFSFKKHFVLEICVAKNN